MAEIKLILGDCLEVLTTLESESVDCCITSPPYWGLRDYGTVRWEGGDEKCDHIETLNEHGGQRADRNQEGYKKLYKETCAKCGATRIDSQLGLEKTPEEYVAKMVEVFREVKRVLKKEGIMFLNLGDSYWGGGFGASPGGNEDFANRYPKQASNLGTTDHETHKKLGGLKKGDFLKSKDLCGIPWRVAFALQADGWYLRQDIIWHKPNPMPESVTDRCTKAHEYIFLLAKNQKYYFDNEAIKEPFADERMGNPGKYNSSYKNLKKPKGNPYEIYQGVGKGWNTEGDKKGRNKRSVWTVTTKPFSGVKITSDYVGRDGKFYKASLDCPIDEHRFLAEKRCKGEYDGLVDFQKHRTSGNESYLFPELVDGYASILPHNGCDDKASAKQNEQMPQSISAHKISEISLNRVVSQNHPHNKDIEQKSACKNDVSSPDNKEIAISHSKQNHKSTSAKVLDDNASDKISCHKSDKQPLSQVSHLDLPYKKYNTAKCTCQENIVDHFATFPEDLILPCVLAGCPKGGMILDPFCGAGTTGVVAKKNNRSFIGIELNQKYVEMSQQRIDNTQELLF